MFLVSSIAVAAIVIDYGFVLDEGETQMIHNIYRFTWWVYILSYIVRLILQWRDIKRKAVWMTLFSGLLLFLSALPRFITLNESWMWLSGVWNILLHNLFLIFVICYFALIEVSRGVVSFINKKTNPATLMAVCFAVIILFGALLLLLPRSTLDHIRLPVVDALFVSTSAVCVTGLSTVDIAQTFSTEGMIIIALLIQIGGLGVMTITSFFAMFFMGGTGLFNQFALRDMVGSEQFSSLISTLLYILGFTFVIEVIGAFGIWLSIHSTMGMTLREEIFFSIFHSISAFCNAGFSTMSGNLGNEAIITNHNGFFLVISILIILGGIGFPILMNIKRLCGYHLRKLLHRLLKRDGAMPRYTHITNINTRIVLIMTMILLSVGTVAIAILEWNGAFDGMPTFDKIVHSFFNAVAPRTAGFNSVDLGHFSILTILLYILLMWIGGASQSTAGGIKVNTFAVALANLMAVIRGRDSVTLFQREIAADSVRRASAVLFGSIITIVIFFVSIVALEPDLPVDGLLFEVVSAFGTVGSSLNITPLLSSNSKVLILILMFVGRVGMITVLMSFLRHGSSPKYRFPKDNVIIN